MGDLSVWDNAEKTLRAVLDEKMPGQWHVNEEDAAFYGPKLDFQLVDALKRPWQCGTIQLDFNLPERFNLKYRAPAPPAQKAVEGGAAAPAPVREKAPDAIEGGDYRRPVMIHRAILGSLERFMAIITESTGGKW